MTSHSEGTIWRNFTVSFAVAALALVAVLYGFIVLLDPFGVRASPSRGPTPIMDLNQRFMYPQIVRTGRYDSAVFGTSTLRLLEPVQLERAFGGRFANFGMNAATPWEQMQLMRLFLRHQPNPKTLILGIDENWCEPLADRKRLTFRAFPPWLYDEDRFNDYPKLLNLTTLEIAGRVAVHRLGLMPERIPPDGYENFLPDESLYDVARARQHIAMMVRERGGEPGAGPPRSERTTPPRNALLPGLVWLDEILTAMPRSTSVLLVFPPVHAAMLPTQGTQSSRQDAACKARTAEIARAHGATVVDFRLRSPVTRSDTNYWDGLHYRVGIASRIVDGLRDAQSNGGDDPAGFYRILNRPPP